MEIHLVYGLSLLTVAFAYLIKPGQHIEDVDAEKRYAFSSKSWNDQVEMGKPIRWTVADLTDDETNISADEIIEGITRSLNHWSNAVPSLMFERNDADYDMIFKPANVDEIHGILGRAWYPRDGNIEWDVAEVWYLSQPNVAPSGTYDFERMLTHEVGHSLGLKHSDDDGALMFPYYREVWPLDHLLALDDINGIRARYARNGTCINLNGKKHYRVPEDLCCSSSVGESWQKYSNRPSKQCSDQESTCEEGYLYVGQCIDIDECAHLIGLCGWGDCLNTNGSYTCICDNVAVYDEEKKTCVVHRDECLEMDCGHGTCINYRFTPSYCLCDDGYKNSNDICIDKNECEYNACGVGKCTNTEGSYTCECPADNSNYDAAKNTCVDKDECTENNIDCGEEDGFCQNLQFSYQCICRWGYSGVNDVCTVTDPCEMNGDTCNDGTCVSGSSSFTCDCSNSQSCSECGGYEAFADGQCTPEGFRCSQKSNSCYKFQLWDATWEESKNACEEMKDTYLLAIESDSERDDMVDLIKKESLSQILDIDTYFWIGGKNEGNQWYWNYGTDVQSDVVISDEWSWYDEDGKYLLYMYSPEDGSFVVDENIAYAYESNYFVCEYKRKEAQ